MCNGCNIKKEGENLRRKRNIETEVKDIERK